MQKSVPDKLQDEDLEVIIRQASEAIQRHCNRLLLPAASSTKSFEFLPNTNNWDLIDLKPYEFRAVKKVTLDPDLTSVELVATQYRSYPYPSRDGTFFGLRFAELPETVPPSGLRASGQFPYQTRRVDVEADWGLGAIPQELQHWANVTVEAWVKIRKGLVAGGQEVDLGEGPVPIIDDLPVAVRRGLRRWERPTVSA